MKKIFLLITILFVSVISTACINNLAVQELNNKAKEYMANGETEKAICRLRSSIDLDDSIFETSLTQNNSAIPPCRRLCTQMKHGSFCPQQRGFPVGSEIHRHRRERYSTLPHHPQSGRQYSPF